MLKGEVLNPKNNMVTGCVPMWIECDHAKYTSITILALHAKSCMINPIDNPWMILKIQRLNNWNKNSNIYINTCSSKELTFYHQAHTEILPRLAVNINFIKHHTLVIFSTIHVCPCSTYIDDLQQDDKQSKCKVGGTYRLYGDRKRL